MVRGYGEPGYVSGTSHVSPPYVSNYQLPSETCIPAVITNKGHVFQEELQNYQLPSEIIHTSLNAQPIEEDVKEAKLVVQTSVATLKKDVEDMIQSSHSNMHNTQTRDRANVQQDNGGLGG
ncbi:hypothetical protein Sjap_015017 [Stephania japonica]|uniref:Uncharacterized protein n=1 Tax=Stephania japonica TaxID=461633 RepID=A0AAP0IJ48_9MAGN